MVDGAYVVPVDSRNARIAQSVFRVLVRKLLDTVPVAGPWLGLGFDLVDAVKNEVDDSRPLTRQQVVRLLAEMDRRDSDAIVDDEMATPDGIDATARLSTRDIRRLNHQLKALPSELASELATAEAAERRTAAASVAAASDAAARRAASTAAERVRLERLLTDQVREQQWKSAYRTVIKRMRLGGVTADIRRAERFLYRARTGPRLRRLWAVPFGVWLLGGLFGFQVLVSAHGWAAETTLLLLYLGGLIPIVIVATPAFGRMNRATRTWIALVPFTAGMVILCVAVLHLPG